MAEKIQEEGRAGALIGIGTSIDKMKFRVFFDEEIQQGALKELIAKDSDAYVVITGNDLKENPEDAGIFAEIVANPGKLIPEGRYTLIKKDKIIAKKMALDGHFFRALLKFDKPAVQSYVLEDIYLIEKRKEG